MAKLLPFLVLLLALGGGAASGFVLRPPPDPEAEIAAPPAEPEGPAAVATFENAFAVPVLRGGRTWGHVILMLGVEADGIPQEELFAMEPILRDRMMEALFLHGSLGDFDGDFTEPLVMARLRTRLNEAVQSVLDDPSARALIVSTIRQRQ